jgi:hypothetical protein
MTKWESDFRWEYSDKQNRYLTQQAEAHHLPTTRNPVNCNGKRRLEHDFPTLQIRVESEPVGKPGTSRSRNSSLDNNMRGMAGGRLTDKDFTTTYVSRRKDTDDWIG